MKKVISLTLIALVMSYTSIGQTKGKASIYGYVQQVFGGAAPDRSASADKQSNTGGTNYYIYLTLSTSSRVYPSEMWIKGDLYGVESKTITKTPVTLESMDFTQSDPQILVPKTTQKVIQLWPISSNGVKNSAKAKTLAKTNEVVVVYKLGGKFYYVTLKSLKSLQAAAMQ